MKKIGLKAVIFLSIIGMLVSCNKDDADNIADCIGEGLLFSMHHDADAQNPKLINFHIEYGGTHTLNNSIVWDFGDGQTATVTGLTTSHTYAAAGSFHVKATVKFTDKDCSPDVNRTVNVE